MDQTYANTLRRYVTDPGSYTGSPGFQFAKDQGMQALNSTNSRMRGSGNALAALVNYGTGVAQQDYGNTIDRLGRLSGQEQQYDLGQTQNANTATANANQYALGQEQNRLTGARDANSYQLGLGANANTAQNNRWNYSLGRQQNDNTARGNDQQFGLGMYRAGNDFNLGMTNAGNQRENNWWNYNLGGQQNANTAARNANDYSLGQGQNSINWFDANTRRGAAQSGAFNDDQRNQAEWQRANPRNRIAGFN